MRTKVLLGLAVLAAGLTTALADGVYSVNVVGYVNVTLQSGKLHYLSIPLAPTDGNWSINNTIKPGDAQIDAKLFIWKDTQWDPDNPIYYGEADMWDPAPIVTNGVSFFMVSKANSVLTFVGEVPQSTTGPIKYDIEAGLSTLANKIPLSTNFPGIDVGHTDDKMWVWDQTKQDWESLVWINYGTDGWDKDGNFDSTDGPKLEPTQGVFYMNKGTAIAFERQFTVK